MTRILVTVLLLCVIAVEGPVAKPATKYADAGGWGIWIDASMGGACFASTRFEGGATLRVSFDVREGVDRVLFVLVGDRRWASIEYGKIYHITVRLGRKGPWEVAAVGYSFDPPEDQPFLQFEVERQYTRQGLLDFMQQDFFAVEYKGREILRLDLEGSYRAGLKMMECQRKSLDAKVKGAADPFRGASSPSRDPFQ